MRMSQPQLEALLSALVLAETTYPDDPHVAEWQLLGRWVASRYTRRWGLPPRARAVLEAAADGQ